MLAFDPLADLLLAAILAKLVFAQRADAPAAVVGHPSVPVEPAVVVEQPAADLPATAPPASPAWVAPVVIPPAVAEVEILKVVDGALIHFGFRDAGHHHIAEALRDPCMAVRWPDGTVENGQ